MEVETVNDPAPETTTSAPVTEVPKEASNLPSEKIREMLETKKEAPKNEPVAKEDPKSEQPKAEEWFDKEKGFKTKEDAIKSYNNLQETLRQKSEREKQLQNELESLKEKANERPLTQEEKDHQSSLEKWKHENKEAIEFLKGEIKKDIEREDSQKNFENEAFDSRKKWKEEFDKDESRRVLWPVMEQVFKNEYQEAVKNPFPFIEAMAFQKEFPRIAEKIRAEAIEQYKAKVKEAEEAEKQKRFALPGGPKSGSGDTDPSKMSSKELASLLPRNENG